LLASEIEYLRPDISDLNKMPEDLSWVHKGKAEREWVVDADLNVEELLDTLRIESARGDSRG